MIHYRVIEETLYHEDLGQYTAYGISAYSVEDGETKLLAHISDVFLDMQKAEQFASLCNRLALDPIHLPDVVADMLGVPESQVYRAEHSDFLDCAVT